MPDPASELLSRKVADYKRLLAYLDGCGEFTFDAFVEANRIAGTELPSSRVHELWAMALRVAPPLTRSDDRPVDAWGPEYARWQLRKTAERAIAEFESITATLQGARPVPKGVSATCRCGHAFEATPGQQVKCPTCGSLCVVCVNPNCQKTLQSKQDLVGMKIRCRHCRESIRVSPHADDSGSSKVATPSGVAETFQAGEPDSGECYVLAEPDPVLREAESHYVPSAKKPSTKKQGESRTPIAKHAKPRSQNVSAANWLSLAAWLAVGLAALILLGFLARLINNPVIYALLVCVLGAAAIILLGFFVWACGAYAASKGRSRGFGWLGLAGAPGLILLYIIVNTKRLERQPSINVARRDPFAIDTPATSRVDPLLCVCRSCGVHYVLGVNAVVATFNDAMARMAAIGSGRNIFLGGVPIVPDGVALEYGKKPWPANKQLPRGKVSFSAEVAEARARRERRRWRCDACKTEQYYDWECGDKRAG